MSPIAPFFSERLFADLNAVTHRLDVASVHHAPFPEVHQELIDKAHANNILCNYFYCDEPEKAVEYMKMGVDTLLTNNCLAIARAFERAGIL
jgi:glycerophosphoryl diester phosphodiesterase